MAQRVRPATIVLWVLRLLAAALFLFAALQKLTSQPMMVTEFEQVGLGQWFRYVTAGLEIIGGVSILIPRVSILGALLLLCVDLGALVAQATRIHGDVVHTIVIALLLAILIYMQRDFFKQFRRPDLAS